MAITGAAAVRAILAVACCLGLAARDSAHSLTAAPASPASPATPAGTPAPHRTPTPAATATPARPRHAAVCRTSQLTITMLRGLAAGGTAGGYLGFTSHARTPCVLH